VTSVDALRRAAGAGRSSRWWDRWQFACALIVAVICIGLGFWSLLGQVQGRPESARVVSCSTERMTYDRWPGSTTTCEVMTAESTLELETARQYGAGSEITLRRNGDSLSDPEPEGDRIWFLPVGVLVALGAWWAGLAPRTDLEYGRHAAARG
jgi:hypothetical protein